MIVYKTNLTDEGRKALVEIALESPKNIRKRKVIMPISAILAVLGIPNGLYFCINGAYSYGIVTLICSFIMLFIAFKAKDFQRFVLRKRQEKEEKEKGVEFREGTVEYIFDNEGITVKSQVANGLNYWTGFKEYGSCGKYIFIKSKDNHFVLVDKNDLTSNEMDELLSLLSNKLLISSSSKWQR